ncbi:hypothetical protein ACOHYD_03635 [Desulfobacterota bacterium M19]
MKKIRDRWRNRRRYLFSEMPVLLLVFIGSGAFLVAGYSGLELKNIVPLWISTVNKIGYFDLIGTGIGFVLLLWGAVFWFFSCIAARCHGVLYSRLFMERSHSEML